MDITYNGEIYAYDDQFSILDALDEEGADPDYSCRSGVCEACKCRLISGTVEWLQQPSIKLNQDEILTCSTIPTSDIELDSL